MKRILFTAILSLTLTGLNASAPCASYLCEEQTYDPICNTPCPKFCPETCVPSITTPTGRLTFKGDFLWWKASTDEFGLQYLVTDTTVSPDDVLRTVDFMTWNWKPGYRVGANYAFNACDRELDLFVLWTSYRTTTGLNRAYDVTFGESLFLSDNLQSLITVPTSQLPNALVEYRNTGSMKYERLDLGLMSAIYNCTNFSLSPSVAFTYVYVKETFESFLERDVTLFTGFGNINSTYVGYGSTLGLLAQYSIGSGFGLYSDTQLTGLWGKQTVDTLTSSDPATGDTVITTGGYDQWLGRYIFTQEIGVEYTTCMFDTFSVNLHAGWQYLYLPRFALFGFNSVADASINGLVAGLDVSF